MCNVLDRVVDYIKDRSYQEVCDETLVELSWQDTNVHDVVTDEMMFSEYETVSGGKLESIFTVTVDAGPSEGSSLADVNTN
jgi:hypothetical protein